MESWPRLSIRVFIFCDVRFYREGLSRVLASTDEIDVLGTAAGTEEGLRQVSELQPDVVLLDTGVADGPWVAQQVADAIPEAKIVALAVPQTEEELIVLLEAGVLGYVTREQSLEQVVAAITSVVREETVCSAAMRTLVGKRIRTLATEVQSPMEARLTARELEILELVAQGRSNKEIAGELHIELPTVKNHVHNILDKLQVQTRTAAVAKMRVWGGPLRLTSAPGVAAAAR